MSARQGLLSAGLLAALMLVGLLVAAGSRQVVAENQWPIQWIEVQGEFHRVSAEQVRAATVPAVKDGFFGVDLGAVQARVETLPWVRAAEVRKVWPDQVEVRVAEHQPLAQWGDSHLVSELGDVFTVEGVVTIEGLPQLVGPEGSASRMIAFFGTLRERLVPTGLDVTRLELSGRGGWLAVLSDGMELTIGRDDPEGRIDRLVSVLDDLRADPTRRPAAVDLRYTNGFAVRWQAVDPIDELLASRLQHGEHE